MIESLMEKNRNKPYELNKQDSGIGGVYDAIDDAYSSSRLDTANKLRMSRERKGKRRGDKGKRRGGKKKRKKTKKKKRRRRKKTKKKRR
jgi:hypothetical protein